jgi:hypothetical protein
MPVQQLPQLLRRTSLVLAPLLHLSAGLAAASLATGATAEVATIGRAPGRFYLFTLLLLLGTALFVPAVIELMHRCRDRAPFPATVGAGLMQIGVIAGIADAGTGLVYWQLASHDANAAQVAGQLHRFENAPGATVIFMIGGLSLMAGSILLAVALTRAHVVPIWAAACLPVGLIASVVANASGSRPMLVAASLILLAGLGRIAARREPAASSATLAGATA